MVLSPRPRRYEAHGRPWHATIWRFPSWLRAWFNTWHLVLLEASWFGVYHPLFDMTGFASPFVPFRLCFVATYQHLICYPANASAKGQEMVYNVRQVTTIGTGAFTHGWLHFSLQSDLVVWISWYSTPTKTIKNPTVHPWEDAMPRSTATISSSNHTLLQASYVDFLSGGHFDDTSFWLRSTARIHHCSHKMLLFLKMQVKGVKTTMLFHEGIESFTCWYVYSR